MENIISSLARFTKKQVDSVKKAITQYAGQVINLVPEPIRRTVNTLTGNLMTKINGIFENKKKLPPNAVEESSPQQVVNSLNMNTGWIHFKSSHPVFVRA